MATLTVETEVPHDDECINNTVNQHGSGIVERLKDFSENMDTSPSVILIDGQEEEEEKKSIKSCNELISDPAPSMDIAQPLIVCEVPSKTQTDQSISSSEGEQENLQPSSDVNDVLSFHEVNIGNAGPLFNASENEPLNAVYFLKNKTEIELLQCKMAEIIKVNHPLVMLDT